MSVTMTPTMLSTTIMLTGFAIAFAHAVLPTHWLPFVLAGQGQKWSRMKTLVVTACAGLAHAAFTAVLGVLIVFVGMQAESWNEDIFHLTAGGILLAFGGFYIWRQFRGRPAHCCHGHALPIENPTLRTDRAVVIGLLMMLALSPCEGFLPVYLSAIHYGWIGFVMLTVILAVATALGMVFFTSLALLGWDRLRLKTLEHYESLVLGVLLVILGVVVMTLEH